MRSPHDSSVGALASSGDEHTPPEAIVKPLVVSVEVEPVAPHLRVDVPASGEDGVVLPVADEDRRPERPVITWTDTFGRVRADDETHRLCHHLGNPETERARRRCDAFGSVGEPLQIEDGHIPDAQTTDVLSVDVIKQAEHA